MASASAVTLTRPAVCAGRAVAGSEAFFRPLRLPAPAPVRRQACNQLKIRASSSSSPPSSAKEMAVSGLTTAALAAALIIPDVAEAAQPGISPSLKNFLLSIVAGGVVLAAIVGAVIAVANFDPVKRS